MISSVNDPPANPLTYLFTDIEGSTRLWESHHSEMIRAHERQAEIIVARVREHGGENVRERGEGDSTFSVFSDPARAVAAALSLQRGLVREPWPAETPIRVRAALHQGPSELHWGDYNSADVNRCARIRSLAAGGQTLLSEAVATSVTGRLPDSASLLDLGMHRLKDLSRPERIFQLCHPDLPAEFPRLRSLDTLPTNLPQQLTSFIGRDRELRDIAELLDSTRLLTITGAGGAGKTRLALQVGAEQVDRLPDGVWLVELDKVSDATGIRYAALHALDLREEAGRSALDTLSAHLREREMLLILDNCEHLVEEAARFAEGLLRAAPRLRILATSREPLGIFGETAWRIPSLALPDPAGGAVDEVRRSPAVRLFVDRARAARPTFDLTPKAAASVAQVCRRLDGIPLAIELAAARARVLSVEQIAERLDDRFRLLTGGSRTALPRQQTLRALIDWSYDLLRPEEKIFLRRLAAFSDGWTLEAAESVCAGPSPEGPDIDPADVLDHLESLVDKSLVLQPDESFREPRYRMLETVRHYAGERLEESGERSAVRDRHQEWCVEFARQVDAGIVTDEVAYWFGRAHEERENLRSAMAWRAASPDAQVNPLRIVGSLQRFWGARREIEMDRRYIAEIMKMAENLPRDRVVARALYSMGFLCYSIGNLGEAWTWCERSLAAYREIEERPGSSDVLNVMGLIAWKQSRHDDARALFTESLELRRAAGTLRGVAAALHNLAILANEQGDNVTATRMQTEALQIQRELGDRTGAAGSLNNLGISARDEGDLEAARDWFRQSLEEYQEVSYASGISLAHSNLGLLSLLQGNLDEAFEIMSIAADEWMSIGNRAAVVEQVRHLWRVWMERGDVRRAALLAGAVHALAQRQEAATSPFERRMYERWESDLRASLPPEEWQRLFARGEQMALEEAISLATDTTIEWAANAESPQPFPRA